MKKLFIFLAITIVIVFAILMVNTGKKLDLKKQASIHDNINKILLKIIDSEKTPPLSLSIALSSSRSIQDVVLDNDKILGHKVLKASAESLKKYSNKANIYIQIFTKDLNVFARSWESSTPIIPLVTGRKAALRESIKYKKPMTGIDFGLPLGIKSSSMIMYKDEFLGILEVTTPYETMVSKIREYGIEIIPLISLNFVPMIYVEQKSLFTVGGSLVVANENTNHALINRLKALNEKELNSLMSNDFVLTSSHFFASYPLKNSHGKRLGAFIAIIKKADYEDFLGEQKSLLRSVYTIDSSKEDIYNYIKNQEENIFLGIENKHLAELNNLADAKDKLDINKASKVILQDYSKEELIELILRGKDNKVIEGEIR